MSRTPSAQAAPQAASASVWIGSSANTSTSAHSAGFASEAIPTHAIEANVRCMEMATERTAWTAESDGCIRVRSLPTGTVLKVLERKSKTTFCTALLLVEGKIWAAYSDGFMRRYDAKTASLEREVVQHDGAVYALHYGAGRVYSGGADWKVYQWNPSSCEYQRLFFGHSNSVRALTSAQTSLGVTLFSGSDDATIRAWDPHAPLQNEKDIACLRTFKGHTKAVLALEVVPQRKQLWSGSEDSTIRVWSLEAFQCVATLERHRAPVDALAFVDTRCWSGGKDGTLFLWDAKTFAPVQTLLEGIHVSPKYVMCIKRLYRGHYYKLWTSTSDGYIQCWNSDCSLAGADGFELLSAEEEAARKRDAARIEGLQEALYEHGAMLNSKEDELKALRLRVEILKDPAQNPDLIALADRCDMLTNDLEEVLRQREALTQRIQMSDDLLAVTRQRLLEAEARQDDHDSGVQGLHEELARTSTENVSLKEALRSVREERDTLAAQCRQQQADAEELSRTMARLEGAIRSHQHLFADNERLRREVEQLEQSLATEQQHRRPSSSGPTASRRPLLSAAAATGASPGIRRTAATTSPRGGSTGRHSSAPAPRGTNGRRHTLDSSSSSSDGDGNGDGTIIPSSTDDELPPQPRTEVPVAGSRREHHSSQLQEKLDNVVLENESLRQRYDALQSEWALREQEIEQLLVEQRTTNMRAALEASRAESARTIAELRVALKTAVSELETKSSQLDKAVADAAAAHDASRREASKKEKQLMELRDQLAKATAAAENLRVEGERRAAADAQERLELKRQVTDARREADRADRAAAASENAAELRQQLHQAQRDVESANRSIRERKVAEAKLEMELASVREELQAVRLTLPATQLLSSGGEPNQSLNSSVSGGGGGIANTPPVTPRRAASPGGTPRGSSAPVASPGEAGVLLVQLRNENEALRKEKEHVETALQTVLREMDGVVSALAEARTSLENMEKLRRQDHETLRESFDVLEAEKKRYEDLTRSYKALAKQLETAQSAVQSSEMATKDLAEKRDHDEVHHAQIVAQLQERLTNMSNRLNESDAQYEQLCRRVKEADELHQREVHALRETAAAAGQQQQQQTPGTPRHSAIPRAPSVGERGTPSAAARSGDLLASPGRPLGGSPAVLATASGSSPSGSPDDARFTTPQEVPGVSAVIDELEEALNEKSRLLEEKEAEHALLESRMAQVTADLARCISQKRESDDQLSASRLLLEKEREDTVRLERARAQALEQLRTCELELRAAVAARDASEAAQRELRASSEATLKSMHHQYEELRRANEGLEVRQQQLLRDATASAEQQRKLLTQIRDLEAEKQRLESSFRIAEMHLATVRDDHEQLRQQWTALSQTAHDGKQKLAVELAEKEREVRQLQDANHRFQVAADHHEREVASKEAELERLRRQLSEHGSLEATLRRQLVDTSASCDEARRSAAAASDELRRQTTEHELQQERLQAQNERLEIALQRARAELAASTAQVSKLTETRDAAVSGQRAAERALEQSQEQTSSLSEALDKVRAEWNHNKELLAAALEELREVKHASHEQTKLIARDLERAKESTERATATVALREKQLSVLQGDMDRLKEAHETLTARHAEATENWTSTRRALEESSSSSSAKARDMEAFAVNLQQELSALQAQLDRERDSHQHAQQLLRSTHATMTSQSENLVSLTQECDRLQHEVSDLRAAFSGAERARATLAEELERAKQAHDKTIDAHSQLSMKLYEVTQAQASTAAALEGLEGAARERDALAVQCDELNRELQRVSALYAETEQDVAGQRAQLHHSRVYGSELEAALAVVKRALQDRKDELLEKERELASLRAHCHQLELDDMKAKHRIAEAERERTELLHLREQTVTTAGMAESNLQEQKILVDQLTAAEELNEALEEKVAELEHRISKAAGNDDIIASLKLRARQLEEDLARAHDRLARHEDALAHSQAAKDQASALTARLESVNTDLHRVRAEHSHDTAKLEQLLRESEDRWMNATRELEQRAKELRQTEARQRQLESEVAGANQQQRELLCTQSHSRELEGEVRRLTEECAALQRRLAETGPLSQCEMNAATKQLEHQLEIQNRQLREYESELQGLHSAAQSDASLIHALLQRAAGVPQDQEKVMRDCAEASAKAYHLERLLAQSEASLAAAETQLAATLSRVKLLEALVSHVPSPAAASAPCAQPSEESDADGRAGELDWYSAVAARSSTQASREVSLEPNAPSATGQLYVPRLPLLQRQQPQSTSRRASPDGRAVEPIPRQDEGAADVHLVPTPLPTPRGGAPAAVGIRSSNPPCPLPVASIKNPAMVRSYVEHLSAALQSSNLLCAQLQRALQQRVEGQRLAMERLDAIRRAITLSGGDDRNAAFAALLDDAVNYRVVYVEVECAALRSRLESTKSELLAARQERATERMAATDSEVVEELESVLVAKTQALEEARRERNAAKADAAQKGRTIALLVAYLSAVDPSRRGATNTASVDAGGSLAFAAQAVEVGLLRQQLNDLRQRAMHSPRDPSAGEQAEVSLPLPPLITEGAHSWEADIAVERSREVAALHLDLASANQRVSQLSDEKDALQGEITQLRSQRDASANFVDSLKRRLAEQDTVVAQQAGELQLKQRRRDDLLAWVKGTVELGDAAQALVADPESCDTLTVCRHLHRLLVRATTDAAHVAVKLQESELTAKLQRSEVALASARDQITQLESDVTVALEDASLWKTKYDEASRAKSELLQRVAQAEADVLTSQSTLDAERVASKELRASNHQLIAAVKGKEGLVDSLQQRVRALETQVRELESDLELRHMELQSKGAAVADFTRDAMALRGSVEAADERAAEAHRQLCDATERLSAQRVDEAALRAHTDALERRLQALEERHAADVAAFDISRERLERQVATLRKENTRWMEVADEHSQWCTKAETLSADVSSLTKRLALSQELNQHLKDQLAALERHRVETVHLRSKLGTTATDVAQLRHLCSEAFGVLAPDAEELTVSGYVRLLEVHAEKVRDDERALQEVLSLLEDVHRELIKARQSSHQGGGNGESRASLSLSPSAAALGTGGDEPHRLGEADETATARSIKAWVERHLVVVSKSLCIQHAHISDALKSQRARLLSLADHNKSLSGEVDTLSNQLKQAASKLLRTENSEQLLTFMEPSRDVAVRTLFHVRDAINDIKIQSSLLSGTVAQTKEHWLELYQQMTAHLGPLKDRLTQTQALLAAAFDRCLTAQEKEEMLQGAVAEGVRDERAPGSATQTPRGGGPAVRGASANPIVVHSTDHTFDGLHTLRPSASTPSLPRGGAAVAVTPHHVAPGNASSTAFATPTQNVMAASGGITSSAIVGFGGESAANRDVVARGIVEARRREQQRQERER